MIEELDDLDNLLQSSSPDRQANPNKQGLKVNNFTDDIDDQNAEESYTKSEVVIDSELEADEEAHLQDGNMESGVSFVESQEPQEMDSPEVEVTQNDATGGEFEEGDIEGTEEDGEGDDDVIDIDDPEDLASKGLKRITIEGEDEEFLLDREGNIFNLKGEFVGTADGDVDEIEVDNDQSQA
jgi:hypothetical protein